MSFSTIANTQEISSAEDLIKFEIDGKSVTLKDELGKKIYDVYVRKNNITMNAKICFAAINRDEECKESTKKNLDKSLIEAANFYQVYEQILTVEFDGAVYRLDDEVVNDVTNKYFIDSCAGYIAQKGLNKFDKSVVGCDDNSLRFRSDFIKALSQKKKTTETASNSNTSSNTQEISSAEDLIKFEIDGKTVTLKDELGKKIYDLHERKAQLKSNADSCFRTIKSGKECTGYYKDNLDKLLKEAVNFYQVFDQILTVEFDGKVYRLDDEISKNPDGKRWASHCANGLAQRGLNKFDKSASMCDDNSLRFRSDFIKALSQKKETTETASNSNTSSNTQEISSAEDLIKFEIDGKTVTLKDELGKKIYDVFENKNALLRQAEQCFKRMPSVGTDCPSYQKSQFDKILKKAVNAYLIHDKTLVSDEGMRVLQNITVFDYTAEKLGCPTEDLVNNTKKTISAYLAENKMYMDEFLKGQLDVKHWVGSILGKAHDLSKPNFSEIPMVYLLGNAVRKKEIDCNDFITLAIKFRGNPARKEELFTLLVNMEQEKKVALENQREETLKKQIQKNMLIVSQLKSKQQQLLSDNDDIFKDQSYIKSKFSRNYPDQQLDFMNMVWKYRSLTSRYYRSLSGKKGAPSEREGYKSLETAYSLFGPYFYEDGGKRQLTGNNRNLASSGFPISGITFKLSDNIKTKVKDWKCYVTPPEPNTGKQPICSFFWQRKGSEGNKYVAQIPVWVDNRGYGANHDAVISQNPKRFVGDQLSISGDEIWMFAKEVYGAKNKLGFESTLDQVVIQNLKWKITIEDAIEYNKNKNTWRWK